MHKKKVYLAGPEVFLRDAIEIGRKKKALCSAYGFEGLYPFDNEVTEIDGLRTDLTIFRANKEMMQRADFGVFNLTPFRSATADAGTIFELGLMSGMGKPCFGYSNDPRDLIERIASLQSLTLDEDTGLWRDFNGMAVENFGNADNLMIDCSLRDGGFLLVRNHVEKGEEFTDMRGFAACLYAISTMNNENRVAAAS